MRSQYANMAAYEAYNTQYRGVKETIGSMLWDTNLYTSGATVALVFFNAVRATLDLGNLTQAGQLPSPQAFLARAIRFYVKQRPRSLARAATGNVQTGATSNIQLLINTGILQITIGSKNYGIYPLYSIPSGGGAFGVIATDGDTVDPGEVQDYATCGVPQVDNAFVFSRPLFLAPQINWQIGVTWPAAVALDGGNTNITVALDGDLIRPVQ